MNEEMYEARDFETFWTHYEKLHADRGVRTAHAVATGAAGVLLAAAVMTRRPSLALLAPVVDYAIAQSSHRRNGAETEPWRSPVWHLRAELRLFRRTVGDAVNARRRPGAPS